MSGQKLVEGMTDNFVLLTTLGRILFITEMKLALGALTARRLQDFAPDTCIFLQFNPLLLP